MNIYLCGFMGCGKSTVGKILAEKLKINFTDADNEIVSLSGMTIPEIFEKQGEEGFRNTETQVFKALSEKSGFVVACGGGAVLKRENCEIMKKSGKIVFLKVPEENLIKRLRNDKNPRPVIKNKTDEEIIALYEGRLPLYLEAADLSVDCCENPSENAERIKAALLSEA